MVNLPHYVAVVSLSIIMLKAHWKQKMHRNTKHLLTWVTHPCAAPWNRLINGAGLPCFFLPFSHPARNSSIFTSITVSPLGFYQLLPGILHVFMHLILCIYLSVCTDLIFLIYTGCLLEIYKSTLV